MRYTKSILKPIFIGALSSIILFFLFALPSAMISNPFFLRMTPPTKYEWFVLITTVILGGIYIGLYYYKKQQQNTKAACAATSGSFLGFLAYGCAFCNKILIFLLGISGIMIYFLPIQPYLGVASIGLLFYGIYSVWKM
ncbi:MAG: hypothetical protein AABX98_06790 [Nanoarchaeota archaeon]